MSVEVFVDTNVLYYANTDSADPRHALARERQIAAGAPLLRDIGCRRPALGPMGWVWPPALIAAGAPLLQDIDWIVVCGTAKVT